MTSTVDTGSALTFEVQQPIMLGYGTAARIAAPRFATLRVILQAQRVTTAANTQQNAQRFRAILECLCELALVMDAKKYTCAIHTRNAVGTMADHTIYTAAARGQPCGTI